MDDQELHLEWADFLTPPQIAESLHVSETYVKRALFSGALKGYKVGTRWRITRDDYRAWAKAGAPTKQEPTE